MRSDRLTALGSVALTVFIGAALTIFIGIQSVFAQSAQSNPIFLADLPCIEKKGNLWATGKKDVVLNREIYTSLMNSGRSRDRRGTIEDSEFACNLPNAKNAELDLELGIPSTESGPFLLTFYLNGNQIVSEKVFPGRVTVIKQPLTDRADVPYQIDGTSTLGVKTTCLRVSGCGLIRFFKANLNVVNSPGARK
jgi:hypothetical protein